MSSSVREIRVGFPSVLQCWSQSGFWFVLPALGPSKLGNSVEGHDRDGSLNKKCLIYNKQGQLDHQSEVGVNYKEQKSLLSHPLPVLHICVTGANC